MLDWWMNLSLKGRFYFWGLFGVAVNGLLFLIGLWMPHLLFAAIALLLVGFLMSD